MTGRHVQVRLIGAVATVMSLGLGASSANAQVTRYVSDMQWASEVNGWGPAERDRSNGELGAVDGTTLRIAGTPYVKGLGVHANSEVRVQLGGACTTFNAVVGIDDEVGNNGSVTFAVYGDGSPLYTSSVLTGASDAVPVSVSVGGFNEISLRVSDAGDGPAYDHADWTDARVACENTPGSQFGAPLSLSSLNNPHSVRTVDLNGDGRLDLVVANAGSNAVSVWLGNGNGTFGSRMDFGTGPEPKNVAVGDFNGDGRPDLVTANQGGTGTVSVLLANAAGEFGFGAAVDYAAFSGAHDVAVGDFNGDGILDLLVACWGGQTRLFYGLGGGAFVRDLFAATGAAPHAVAVGDFDANGRLDALIANHDSASLTLLRNTGGAGGTPFSTTNIPVGNGPHSIRTADLNGDGLSDVAVANDASNTISVLLRRPDGFFFNDAVSYPTGPAPKGVAIGDINGDGLADLISANTAGNYPVCCNPGGDTISVLLNAGNGTFAAPQPYTVGTTPFGVAVGDLDGDGKLDVVTANWHSNDVTVLRNGGGGGQAGGYLSDLPWSSMVNGWGPAERDRSNGESGDGDGGTIRLDGITYAKGIGVHSDSRIVWPLNGQCTSFSAVIGVDDEVGAAGSVIFQVYADNQIRLHSDVMTGSTPARNVTIDVTGVNELSLVVHYGWDDFAFDHADWANAQVVCTP